MRIVELAVIEKKIDPQVREAHALTVRSEEDMMIARSVIQGIKQLKKEIGESCDPIIKSAHETHKKAVAQKNGFIVPLDKAQEVIEGKIGGYLDDVEADRRKEAEKIRAAAEKERDKVIERANKKIESLITQAGDTEGQIKAIEDELNNPELTDAEVQLLGAKRDKLIVSRDHANRAIQEAADRAEADASVPVPILGAAPKVKGISSSVKVIPEVVNPMALVKAVADGRVPTGVIKAWDLSVIAKLVGAGMIIPGVSTTTKRNVSVRG